MRRCCLRFITLMLGVTQYESPLGTGAVLVAARVARALHTTSLSDYLLIFFCFNKQFVLRKGTIGVLRYGSKPLKKLFFLKLPPLEFQKCVFIDRNA